MYLKGKSTLMILDRQANLKYKYANSISGAEVIVLIQLVEIKKNLHEDIMLDQKSIRVYMN